MIYSCLSHLAFLDSRQGLGLMDRPIITETLLHNAKAIEKLKSAAAAWEVPDSKNSKKLLTFLMGDVITQ